MRRKKLLYILVSFFFSGFSIYIVFRGIPAKELFQYIKSIDYVLLVPAVLISVLSFILRVIRWQLLLEPNKKVSFKAAYHPLVIGFMANCVLPGRAGELVRPFVLAKKTDIPFSSGLGSVVTERLFDMLCLLVLFVYVLNFIDIDLATPTIFNTHKINSTTLENIVRGSIVVFSCAASSVVLLNFESFRKFIIILFKKLADKLFFMSPRLQKASDHYIIKPLIVFIDFFAKGTALHKHRGKALTCLLLTFVIWLVQAFSYHVMTFSCPGLDITFTETLTIMLIICFFIALPSIPGYWGIWEAGGIFALSLFSVAPEKAAGYTLINHVIQIAPVILAGVISTIIIGVDIRQPHHAATEHEA